MAREFGRDPNKLEFSVLLRGGEGPTDVMKQYKEAGVSRLVVAASAVSDDGVKVVRDWARSSSAPRSYSDSMAEDISSGPLRSSPPPRLHALN
jgi:hypothetical protein